MISLQETTDFFAKLNPILEFISKFITISSPFIILFINTKKNHQENKQKIYKIATFHLGAFFNGCLTWGTVNNLTGEINNLRSTIDKKSLNYLYKLRENSIELITLIQLNSPLKDTIFNHHQQGKNTPELVQYHEQRRRIDQLGIWFSKELDKIKDYKGFKHDQKY